MNDFMNTINKLFGQPQEQWAMSSADNVWGMSLPEYHPAPSTPVPSVELGATDTKTNNYTQELIDSLLASFVPKFKQIGDTTGILDMFKEDPTDNLMQAKEDLFIGAALKTASKAADFFEKAFTTGWRVQDLNEKYSIAKKNYENQMYALDTEVLNIKSQLADRFNKTVQTNIMNLAAKNLRVTAGNVLDLSKEEASEITEDMRTAESNANLKKIALQAKKESAKESTRYAEKQLYMNLIGSALNLGAMAVTGGGTGESWGDLYTGYKTAKYYKKATTGGTLTAMYD